MKTLNAIVIPLVVLWALCCAAPVEAQQRERPRIEETGIKNKLWYGGNLGLGLSAFSDLTFFNFGLFPMVGYKITPGVSVGPRLGIDYSYYRAPSSLTGRPVTANVFSFYSGVFARAKIYQWIFAQAEYGLDMASFPQFDLFGRMIVNADTQRVNRIRDFREQGLVGLGYNSGGLFASEIVAMYDLLLPADSFRNPWVIRFGFTYKF
jgi:hypothetical protein